MSVTFPFEHAGRGLLGDVYRPIATVYLKSLKKSYYWAEVKMLVDTGSDFTILPKYIAEDLQISLTQDCKKATTVGVGGPQSIYIVNKKVKAKIGNIEREIPLAFFDNDKSPALLGRQGFMETMDIEFMKSRTVVFKE
jgi:predicted aspartyl protease